MMENDDRNQMPNNVVALKLEYIEKGLGEIKENLRAINEKTVSRAEFELLQKVTANHVTADQFAPVKLVTYGLVGLILSSVLLYLLQTIIIKH